MSKTKIVRYEIDLSKLPPLNETQKAEFKALAAMSDSEIDVSDIPQLDDWFWKNGVRNPFYKPM